MEPEWSRCLRALRLELPEVVHDDVKRILGGTIARQQQEIDRLREALAWYADARHFERRIEYDRDENPYEGGSEADSDGGDRARAALEGGAS